MIPNRLRRFLGLSLAALACAGCPDLAITRGAEMAASATFDDRSYEQQVADDATMAEVEKSLLQVGSGLTVNVDVYRGRVMLTGVVADENRRRQVAELARRASDVVVVYDDLQVGNGGNLQDKAGDLVTDKELGANLLAAEGIASQSFEHRVVNSTAYILGQASSGEQMEVARRTALGTPGVDGVVLHIEVAETP